MRITRRTSGGRGEYEISEPSPEGLTPTDLVGCRLILELDEGWSINTGAVLTDQGGKRRIRLEEAEIHPHRQLAAALMMPHPVRADQAMGRGAPLLRSGFYAIDDINLTRVRIDGDTAYLVPGEISCRNVTYLGEGVVVGERVTNVLHLWKQVETLPTRIAELVEAHKKAVTGGEPILRKGESLVEELQRAVTEAGTDFGIVRRSEAEDVLPDLMRTLEWAEEPPPPPISIDEIEPEETEIRRRVVREWRRWAAARGAASAKFRQVVREAYRSTCIVCGLHFPRTEIKTAAGVDAAHILPWADYDLDKVQNGLCFCKNHHWAFDEGLLVIIWNGNVYEVSIPDDVSERILAEDPAFSLAELRSHTGPIRSSRLPSRREDWPNPRFLELLAESG